MVNELHGGVGPLGPHTLPCLLPSPSPGGTSMNGGMGTRRAASLGPGALGVSPVLPHHHLWGVISMAADHHGAAILAATLAPSTRLAGLPQPLCY